MMAQITVPVCAMIVTVVCFVLVLHREYEDGLIGRVALSLIGLAAFGRVLSLLDYGVSSWFYYNTHHLTTHASSVVPSGIAVLLWVGVAMFLSRHMYRFLRWHHYGQCGWRPSICKDAPGKRGAPEV